MVDVFWRETKIGNAEVTAVDFGMGVIFCKFVPVNHYDEFRAHATPDHSEIDYRVFNELQLKTSAGECLDSNFVALHEVEVTTNQLDWELHVRLKTQKHFELLTVGFEE